MLYTLDLNLIQVWLKERRPWKKVGVMDDTDSNQETGSAVLIITTAEILTGKQARTVGTNRLTVIFPDQQFLFRVEHVTATATLIRHGNSLCDEPHRGKG